MLDKAVNGYTAAAIDRALRGLDQRLTVRVRGELFDLDNTKLFDLKGLLADGSVTHNVDQPIKRGAALKFLETARDSQHPAPLPAFKDVITAQRRLFHLRMNESGGGAFVDFSGNGRDFGANGGVSFQVGSLTAGDLLDNAVKLNGTNAWGGKGNDTWMNLNNIQLALAWRGTGVSEALICRDDLSTRMWLLQTDANGRLQFRINFTTGAPTVFNSGVAINDGLAHLIHASYDGSNVCMFLDGKRIFKFAETRAMATGTQSIFIGVIGGGTQWSSGTFDEVGMLGRALTPKEIRDEYQAWSAQPNEVMMDKERGDRVRVWYGILMPGVGTDGTPWAEWPLIMAVLTTPLREVQPDEPVTDSISCQDQTRILSDNKFLVRTALQAGENFLTSNTATSKGVLAIARAAGFDTSAWAVTPTTLVALADIDFEIASSALDAISYLLTAINYKPIRFNGAGAAVIEPNKLDVDLPLSDTLATDATSVILVEGLSEQIEARKVINQVIVASANPDTTNIQGNAVNDNSSSESSQVFNTPKIKTVQADVPNQTIADALAQQTLSDSTARAARRLRLKTYPRPIHDDRDRIHLTLPQLGKNEDFVEEEWVLPLGPGGWMEHSFLSLVDVR